METRRQREEFLRLPWRLYRNDPAWIPNLLLLQRDVISEKRNPFFDHGEAQLLLARRDGRTAGRISAQIDRNHNDYHAERTGFFGFFESENDPEVARTLLTEAEAWLRARGMESVRGPFNLSINEPFGLLVEGFEHPPMIEMTHSLPYYAPLIEGAGYAKAMDAFAFYWEMKHPPARMMEAVEKVRAVPGLTLRRVSRLHIHRDVGILLDIFNDAWQENWGFVPGTKREAQKIADDLRLIADPRLTVIAEIDGEPAGMAVALPNLNEAIRDFNGFLNPWNALKLVWRLKVRGLEQGRVMLFGVKRKFRTRKLFGLPFLLLYEVYAGSREGRYTGAEESWVLETNKRMLAIVPHWEAYLYKRYRIYEKAL